MPKQAQHTIVRFSLRSLLAITFGVALVMAVTGSSIESHLNEFNADQWRYLAYAIYLLIGSVVIKATWAIWSRAEAGKKSGSLLLSLAKSESWSKQLMKWAWLLFFCPAAIWFCCFLFANTTPNPTESFSYFVVFLCMPLMYGFSLAEYGLSAWAEGYSNDVEFCENGVFVSRVFYAWSSKKIRSIRWCKHGQKIEFDLQWSVEVVNVPPHQREAVDAILEAYYKPNRPAVEKLPSQKKTAKHAKSAKDSRSEAKEV